MRVSSKIGVRKRIFTAVCKMMMAILSFGIAGAAGSCNQVKSVKFQKPEACPRKLAVSYSPGCRNC